MRGTSEGSDRGTVWLLCRCLGSQEGQREPGRDAGMAGAVRGQGLMGHLKRRQLSLPGGQVFSVPYWRKPTNAVGWHAIWASRAARAVASSHPPAPAHAPKLQPFRRPSPWAMARRTTRTVRSPPCCSDLLQPAAVSPLCGARTAASPMTLWLWRNCLPAIGVMCAPVSRQTQAPSPLYQRSGALSADLQLKQAGAR